MQQLHSLHSSGTTSVDNKVKVVCLPPIRLVSKFAGFSILIFTWPEGIRMISLLPVREKMDSCKQQHTDNIEQDDMER